MRSLASAIRIKPPVNATAVGIVERVKRARGPALKSVVLLSFYVKTMQRAFIEVFKIAKNAFIDPIYLSEYSKVDVA